MTESPDLTLEQEPDFRRLLRYLTLSEGFLLALVHAHTPLASAAILAALPEALAQRRGKPVRMICHDPYRGRSSPTAPLEQERTLEDVLQPLRESPPEDRSRGVVQVIDGSHFLREDEPAWALLFEQMNEQRNALVQGLSCELLLLGPPVLLDLFGRTAPDFWSIRSGEFGEAYSLNLPSPIPLKDFLAILEGTDSFDEEVENSAEAYKIFTRILLHSRANCPLSYYLREPWKHMAQTIDYLREGNFFEAEKMLNNSLVALRENGPSGFSEYPSQVMFSMLYIALGWYLASTKDPQAGRTTTAGIHDLLIGVRQPGSYSRTQRFYVARLLQLQSLFFLSTGDIARAEHTNRIFTQRLSWPGFGDDASAWEEISKLYYDIVSDESGLQLALRWCDASRLRGKFQDEIDAWDWVLRVLTWAERFDTAVDVYKSRLLPAFQERNIDIKTSIFWSRILQICQLSGQPALGIGLLESTDSNVLSRDGMEQSPQIWLILCSFLKQQGKIEEAIGICQNLIEMLRKKGDFYSEAKAHWQLASLMQEKGDFSGALAIQLAQKLPPFSHLSVSINQEYGSRWITLGDCYQSLGLFDEAIFSYKQNALPICQMVSQTRLEVVACVRLTDVMLRVGRFDEAISLLKEYLPIFRRRLTRRSAEGQGLLLKALRERAQGGDQEEASRLEESLATAREANRAEGERIRTLLLQYGVVPGDGLPPPTSPLDMIV